MTDQADELKEAHGDAYLNGVVFVQHRPYRWFVSLEQFLYQPALIVCHIQTRNAWD